MGISNPQVEVVPFPSPEALYQDIYSQAMEVIRGNETGAGPATIRELALHLNRDGRALHFIQMFIAKTSLHSFSFFHYSRFAVFMVFTRHRIFPA
jgi:hypothetical protein